MVERRENTTMSLIGRNAGLALATLLTLFMALAYFRSADVAIPVAPPAPIVETPRPAAPVAKARKKALKKKLVAKLVEPPAAPVKVRGARLKDKGEALGGGTPDRVDTGTMTMPAAR